MSKKIIKDTFYKANDDESEFIINSQDKATYEVENIRKLDNKVIDKSK